METYDIYVIGRYNGESILCEVQIEAIYCWRSKRKDCGRSRLLWGSRRGRRKSCDPKTSGTEYVFCEERAESEVRTVNVKSAEVDRLKICY